MTLCFLSIKTIMHTKIRQVCLCPLRATQTESSPLEFSQVCVHFIIFSLKLETDSTLLTNRCLKWFQWCTANRLWWSVKKANIWPFSQLRFFRRLAHPGCKFVFWGSFLSTVSLVSLLFLITSSFSMKDGTKSWQTVKRLHTFQKHILTWLPIIFALSRRAESLWKCAKHEQSQEEKSHQKRWRINSNHPLMCGNRESL